MPHAFAHRIEGVATSVAALVGVAGQGPTNQPVLVTSLAEFQRTFGGPQGGQDLYLGVKQFFDNDGQRAWVVRLGGTGAAALRRGLDALDGADNVNLLCLPGLSGGSALASAAAYARSRRAFFIGDPAASRAATLAAIEAIRHTDTGHAAVYVPRIRVRDPAQPAATRLCGPAATVAGILARTDIERGVQAFAAGTWGHVRGAIGLGSALDDHQAAALRRHGINVIREVQGHGIVLWGARTVGGGVESADDWKYIPVRRLALYIEESLFRGLDWVVFEPNDEPTWSVIRHVVTTFMAEMFRGGVFPGATAGECFFVQCGLETMTQRDIERGILVVEVGIAPVRPAEFVVFRIRRTRP
jgi:phage tail sheath protein FI